MNLTPFDDAHLPELMSWFPDELSCHTWGGPEFRFPFTEATFREDARLASLSTWALVGNDGKLAGFGQFYLRVGRCHLGRLAIAPDSRGRGLGATLVRGLCRQGGPALGVGTCSLFVVPENDRALRLYRRMGFSVFPYPEPTHALIGYIYMVADPPTGDLLA
ncbi:MAG: GNAT family N-acetyltransferase [Steroidobacteraceae bacterium]